MTACRFAALTCLVILPLAAQLKPKDVRAIAKDGSKAIPRLRELLKDKDPAIRAEAAKSIGEINSAQGLDALLEAMKDNHPEVQIRATDGLVNFYLPGYLQTGLTARIRGVGKAVPFRSAGENDQVVEPYVQVRPDVIETLGKTSRGGSSMDSRANAARAVGILRGKAAVPELLEAMRSKDSKVIYESLVAIQKIQDRSAAPRIRYLLNDFDERVQIAAIQATGLLRAEESAADVAQVYSRTKKTHVRKAALFALAHIPDPNSRALFQQMLTDKDEDLRSAAAEGLGRLRKKEDMDVLRKAFESEGKPSARLSMAFGLVMLGDLELSEFSPLQTLINTLNSKARQGEALALLEELTRNEEVRRKVLPVLATGTKDEKIYIARALGRSGGAESVGPLEKLTDDVEPEVAQEAIRASKSVKSRL
ncbi:MAG: HEAT repeat domain-containing protein [Bryobacteraceae bacterium]